MADKTIILSKDPSQLCQEIPLIEGDNNTYVIRFVAPRYSGGVDLANLTWGVNIKNATLEQGFVNLSSATSDDSAVYIDWNVGSFATVLHGSSFCTIEGRNNSSSAHPVWKSSIVTLRVGRSVSTDDIIDGSNIDSITEIAENVAESIVNNSVQYDTSQSLNSTQKTTARTNIGAVSQAEVDQAIATEATAREAADAELKAYSVTTNGSFATLINASADVNDYTTPGNYRVASSTVAAQIANLPLARAGRLTVDGLTAQSGIFQKYTTTTGAIYTRVKQSDVWGEWAEIATTGQVEAEATAREAADNELNGSITAEATAREAADNELKNDLIGITFDKGVVKNQYVNNVGMINNYDGWDRTRYICVKEWKKLKVTATSASNYNCFYDANKSFIYATPSSRTINIVSGENEIVVPPNAYYAIFSGTVAYIENLVIDAVEKDYEYQDDKFREYIQTDLYGRQVLELGADDLTIGYQLDSNGTVVQATDRVAVTNDYYKLAHPHNKYKFQNNGYMIYIFEYSKDNSGTYNFVKSTTFTDSGTLWVATKTTHIRFYLKDSNSYTLTPYVVADFCDKFQMREQNELNTYLRVCTFNQAADYPHFLSATEEELKTRVHNYLNFIGGYNPDVLCAQEAVGTYFQPVSYQKSTQAVFDRKYFYMYQSGYQRKTWSKYQYTDNAMVTFQSQAEGDSRFYGKQTIHVDGKEIVVLNTHCAYQGESDFDAVRKGQFEELVAEMQQHTYCVCCGDFNAWSADEFDVFKNAGFICANCGDYGVIDTWYVGTDYPDWPFKAVDNIITTPNIVIQNVVRGPYDFTYFSDHAPLIADLQIR